MVISNNRFLKELEESYLHNIGSSISSTTYKPLEEYFIFDGADVSLQCVDNDENDCNNNLNNFRDESHVRFHRVQRYDGTKTQIVSNKRHRRVLRQNRLAYGDIVYAECGNGRNVLRGSSITRNVTWNNRRLYNIIKKSRNDTKCHFRIVGHFSDGNLLTETRKFELQSVHWKDCHVGAKKNSDATVIVNCTGDGDLTNCMKLSFFATPLANKSPRNVLVKLKREVKSFSKQPTDRILVSDLTSISEYADTH